MNIYRQGNPHALQCRHCHGPRTPVNGALFCPGCDRMPLGGRR